jgi:hypothetical protein
VRKRRTRHIKIRKDVRAEGAIELVVGDAVDRVLLMLIRSVVDEDVQPTEGVDGLLNGLATELRIANVAREQETSPPFANHGGLRFLGVSLLLRQIDNGDIGTFACIEHCHGAPDSRIAAGNERHASVELS